MKTLPNQLLRGRISYILFSGFVVFHLVFNSQIIVCASVYQLYTQAAGHMMMIALIPSIQIAVCFRFRFRALKQMSETDRRAIFTPILKCL